MGVGVPIFTPAFTLVSYTMVHQVQCCELNFNKHPVADANPSSVTEDHRRWKHLESEGHRFWIKHRQLETWGT
jgi:hypothetical protein